MIFFFFFFFHTLKIFTTEVKKLLGDKHIDELMLVQFVRGYAYEKENWVARAHEMVVKALEWREKNGIDTICNRSLDKRAEFKKTWVTMVTGEDPKGRLVTVDRLGSIKPSDLLDKFTVEELQLHHAQNQEYVCKMKRKANAKSGHRMYKTVSILDLDGIGMGHSSSKFTGPARSVMDIDQWFYPESLQKMYVVNAPWVFKALWAIVRPWLHPITQSKIQVCSSNFLDELAADGIGKDKLPECLGGTATDHLAEFETEWIKGELWKHEEADAAPAADGKKKKKKKKKAHKDGAADDATATEEGTEEEQK
jgi:hypothetical protein